MDSPLNNPNNLVSGDLANKTTSIWSETISGKRKLNDEEDFEDYIVIEGDELDLDELIYSDIILLTPTKFLCKEDCKGLCPTCGKNLNEGDCACAKQQTDPRLEALRQLLQ